MRNFLYVAVLLVAPGALRAEIVDHFDIVDASDYTITSIAVAKADSGVFRTALDGRGRAISLKSGETLAIATRDRGCLRDLRVTFDNGEVLIERMFDICKKEPFRAAPPS